MLVDDPPNLAGHGDMGPVSAVDVVLPVRVFDDEVDRRVGEWLDQLNCVPVIHLVASGDNGLQPPERYVQHPDVRWHQVEPWATGGGDPVSISDMDPVTAAMVGAHQITPEFETPFVAFACEGVSPIALHLSHATRSMLSHGHEWYAASMRMGARLYASVLPSPRTWRRNVLAATAVVRRSMWVDLEGVASRVGDADIDFFDRANLQERSAAVRPVVVATCDSPLPTVIGTDPRPEFRSGRPQAPFGLHRDGVEFRVDPMKCDVVLPFRGQLGYVEQAIDSILNQRGIDVTLHLIDDATEDDITPWLRRYVANPRVRVYRNRVNVGQFISFNNVIPHVRSDWIATQDGDDVSLPDRLASSVKIGRLCQADLVAAATVLDGPLHMVHRQLHRSYGDANHQQNCRFSCVPRNDYEGYFLENPTIVHRRDYFVEMGGFTDLAHPLRNRTSVDSEYMLRAMYDGANIVASKRLSVVYRVHEQSAIQREETKMGSPIREWAQKELARRVRIMRRGGVHPRTFGALGRHFEITQPWEG